MSILENLKSKTVTAKAVAGDLAKANADLATLKSKLADASLAVVEGKPGAEKALAELNAGMAAARDRIAILGAAHSRLVAREEAEIAAQRAALHKTQIAALRKHLEARDSAADALSIAIAEAVKQFKILVERSKRGSAANPIGREWPESAVSHIGQIQALVAQEIYRCDGGDPMMGNRRSFPGAGVLNLDHQGKPENIVPLADHLRANSKYILDTITGKAPGA